MGGGGEGVCQAGKEIGFTTGARNKKIANTRDEEEGTVGSKRTFAHVFVGPMVNKKRKASGTGQGAERKVGLPGGTVIVFAQQGAGGETFRGATGGSNGRGGENQRTAEH